MKQGNTLTGQMAVRPWDKDRSQLYVGGKLKSIYKKRVAKKVGKSKRMRRTELKHDSRGGQRLPRSEGSV